MSIKENILKYYLFIYNLFVVGQNIHIYNYVIYNKNNYCTQANQGQLCYRTTKKTNALKIK